MLWIFYQDQNVMRKDLAKVFFGEAVSKGLILITSLVLINKMTVAEYADFTLFMTMLMLGAQLACSAVERLYIADYDQFAGYAWQLLLCCVVIFAAISFCYLYKSTELVENTVVCFGILALSAYQFRRIIYQQQQMFSLYVAADLLKNSGWLLLVLAALYLNGEINALWVVSFFFMSCIAGYLVVPFPVKSEAHEWKGIIKLGQIFKKYSAVYFYTGVAATIPYLPIMLANYQDRMDLVATYGAAMRYQAILAMLAQVINVVYLPKLASQKNSMQLAAFNSESMKIILLLVCMASGLIAAITAIIPYVDGGKYPDSQGVFIIFSISTVASIMATPSINHLLMDKQYRYILLVMLIGFFGTIFFSEVAKVSYPIYGIALSSLLGCLLINSLIVMKGWKLVINRQAI